MCLPKSVEQKKSFAIHYYWQIFPISYKNQFGI
jgi:hypothetical protein